MEFVILNANKEAQHTFKDGGKAWEEVRNYDNLGEEDKSKKNKSLKKRTCHHVHLFRQNNLIFYILLC